MQAWPRGTLVFYKSEQIEKQQAVKEQFFCKQTCENQKQTRLMVTWQFTPTTCFPILIILLSKIQQRRVASEPRFQQLSSLSTRARDTQSVLEACGLHLRGLHCCLAIAQQIPITEHLQYYWNVHEYWMHFLLVVTRSY